MDSDLLARANNQCEMCSSSEDLETYTVTPKSDDHIDHQIVACSSCLGQIQDPEKIEANHWRCLNESIWSEVEAVKVVSYRMLKNLQSEAWAQELMGMMYLEDETKEWAENVGDEKIIHKDSNGNILQAGDSVTLIQDLNVKGAGFTAKRGTAVRRIRLVHDNAEHIEGKVDGQQIVILTKYVKKTS